MQVSEMTQKNSVKVKISNFPNRSPDLPKFPGCSPNEYSNLPACGTCSYPKPRNMTCYIIRSRSRFFHLEKYRFSASPLSVFLSIHPEFVTFNALTTSQANYYRVWTVPYIIKTQLPPLLNMPSHQHYTVVPYSKRFSHLFILVIK